MKEKEKRLDLAAKEQDDIRKALFDGRRKWRIDRGDPKLTIEIHGPRRDYDYSLFCCDHNVEAEECAAEWSAELIDDLQSGETATIRLVVRDWEPNDVCSACEEDPPVRRSWYQDATSTRPTQGGIGASATPEEK